MNLLAWSVEVLADLLGYCLLSYDFLLSMHLVMTVQYRTVQSSTVQEYIISQVVMVSAGITPLVYLAGAEELAKLLGRRPSHLTAVAELSPGGDS